MLDTSEEDTDAGIGVLALVAKGFGYELKSPRNRPPRATAGCVAGEVAGVS